MLYFTINQIFHSFGSNSVCTHSRSRKEEMSRARSDLSPAPLIRAQGKLSFNKGEPMHPDVESYIAGPRTSRATEPFMEHSDNRMRSGSCMWQCVGLCFAFLGWMSCLATTLLREWMTMNNDIILSEQFSIGIWETCVAQDEGSVQCKAYDSLFDLPEDIQLARSLMCTSIALGLLSLVLSLSGSNSVTCCGDDNAKKEGLMISGGVLSILAGVMTLIPVSYIAHLTVVQFWATDIPDYVPRWEFGQALFVGWASSFLLLSGGVLLISAQCCYRNSKNKVQLRPPLRTERRQRQLWYKVEYV
ncbi:putative claudin-24 [Hypanus sabinus]|uniref:putative claudin-24 n=1 Tax=Hypanus sabinus TaxID=79690 RepID=UPI0028C49F02|nr:putative claudin-24 [Hypanus sabinus]